MKFSYKVTISYKNYNADLEACKNQQDYVVN